MLRKEDYEMSFAGGLSSVKINLAESVLIKSKYISPNKEGMKTIVRVSSLLENVDSI